MNKKLSKKQMIPDNTDSAEMDIFLVEKDNPGLIDFTEDSQTSLNAGINNLMSVLLVKCKGLDK